MGDPVLKESELENIQFLNYRKIQDLFSEER